MPTTVVIRVEDASVRRGGDNEISFLIHKPDRDRTPFFKFSCSRQQLREILSEAEPGPSNGRGRVSLTGKLLP